MASPLPGPLLHGLCAVLAGAAPAAAGAGAAQAGFAVRIELTLPAGCRSSVERTAGGGARVTLTCGDNLFVNVRPTLVSAAVAPPPSTPSTPPAGPDTAAPATPAADDTGGGDGQRDGVLYVLAAASDVAEMWVIF